MIPPTISFDNSIKLGGSCSSSSGSITSTNNGLNKTDPKISQNGYRVDRPPMVGDDFRTSGSTFDAPIIPITNPTGAAPAAELGDDNVDKDTTSSGEYSEDIKRHFLDIYTQCRRLL